MLKYLVLALTLTSAVGCGGDDEGGGPPPKSANGANPEGPGAAAPPGAGSGSALKAYAHVEEIVTEEERETIRHEFKERDFVIDASGENRDPFQSYVLMQVGLQAEAPTVDPATELCAKRQMVATNYSVRDLKLSGIVARGTRHFALMQDSANFGHIVARGDCVGREKARVKDIGAGYITFEITPETVIGVGGVARPAEERSVQLYPGELTVTTPGGSDNKRDGGNAVMPGQTGTTPNNQ